VLSLLAVGTQTAQLHVMDPQLQKYPYSYVRARSLRMDACLFCQMFKFHVSVVFDRDIRPILGSGGSNEEHSKSSIDSSLVLSLRALLVRETLNLWHMCNYLFLYKLISRQ